MTLTVDYLLASTPLTNAVHSMAVDAQCAGSGYCRLALEMVFQAARTPALQTSPACRAPPSVNVESIWDVCIKKDLHREK